MINIPIVQKCFLVVSQYIITLLHVMFGTTQQPERHSSSSLIRDIVTKMTLLVISEPINCDVIIMIYVADKLMNE